MRCKGTGRLVLGAALVFSAMAAVGDDKPYVGVRILTHQQADAAVSEALATCQAMGYQVSVALVDRSGNLQAFLRDPLAGEHTIEVSRLKATTSATFQTSTTQMMEDPTLQVLSDAPGVLLIGGGLPIRVGGQFYGAIGVSGAPAEKKTGDIDEKCAQAGIDAIREAIEFAE